MFMTMNSETDNTLFEAFKKTLNNWLSAKIDHTGHLISPTEVPFFAQPTCNKHIGHGTAAQSIGFIFKHGTDPADLRPLRGLQMTLNNGGTLTCGKTNETPQTLDISNLVCITKVTTHYCQYTGDDEKTLSRYKKRIVSIIIEYDYKEIKKTSQNTSTEEIKKYAVAFYSPSSKFTNKLYTSGTVCKTENEIKSLYNNFNDIISSYNKSNDKYNIFTEQSKNIEENFKWCDKYLSVELSYIFYSQFKGQSRDYIDNFSLIFKSSTPNTLSDIVNSSKKISIFAPFYKYRFGENCKLTLSADLTQTNHCLEITEKSTSHTIRIPEINISDNVSISNAYERTSDEKTTTQKEDTTESKNTNSVELTVGDGYYVAAGFPSQRTYQSNITLRFFDDTAATANPTYSMKIPLAVNTPSIAAGSENALVLALLECI